jgi:hypothetical protein
MTSKIHTSDNIEYSYKHPRAFIAKYFPEDLPGEETNILKYEHDLGTGAKVVVYAYGKHIFVNNGLDRYNSWDVNGWQFREFNIQVIETEKPFVSLEVIGNAYHKKVTIKKRKRINWNNYEDYEVIDWATYVSNYKYIGSYQRKEILEKTNFLKVKFSTENEVNEVELEFAKPNYGHVDTSKSTQGSLNVSLNFFGITYEWDHSIIHEADDYIQGWDKFYSALNNFTFDDVNAAWDLFLKSNVSNVNTKSIASIEKKKKIAPNLERLKKEQPTLYNFYQWIHDGQIRKGVSNNQLLSVWLKSAGEDYNKIVSDLTGVMAQAHIDKSENEYKSQPTTRDMCLLFSEAKEKDREKREHKEWYLRQGNASKAEGLGCIEKLYPRTHKAITDGNIPINVFHDPKDKLKAINTEWGLWEKALERPGWAEPLFKISKDASRRSTYDKDVTPYISFLFKIEKYLDRHAPRPKPTKRSRKKVGWQAMPKYVESQWQLEMDEANETGTVKKRSALTPLPDNDTGTIEVPYAAIAISGRQTTYCYSQYYFVLEDGFIDYETQTPVVNELEKKLNGRDDYGLMYYTLTGSPTNRGYPTFLVIFERRKDFTHVHFHRVHPNKYKDGRPVPVSRLIEECYRYMAGNVRAEEIHAQQGDLIFIRCEEPKNWNKEDMNGISEFESHAFVVPEGTEPVSLLENKSKSVKNRLGHILSKKDFVVKHPEHEELTDMSSGWYEIRRCKSWEANPTAVWSFTID